MALGTIELTTISRAQDYSIIKHNEDAKAALDNNNGMIQMQKNDMQKSQGVYKSDDTKRQDKKFDARDKGSNEYYGSNGEKKKKEQPKDRVVVKKASGFDIKI